MGNYYNHDFVVTKDNKLTLQTVELPAKIIPGKLQVSGQGLGCALIQVKVCLKSVARMLDFASSKQKNASEKSHLCLGSNLN